MLHRLGTIGKWLRHEAAEARSIFLFFLIGFLLQLLIIKLVLAEFSIPLFAISKALLGAVLAAKAVLILDTTPLARKLERYPRAIAVAVKTLLYGGGTLMLGYLERFLDALFRTGSLDAAIRSVTEQMNLYRLFAWVLGISLVFAIYFVWSEISERMGEGALWALFFERP
ncbi:MAG TPA: hypothetical protein VMV13_04740 [Candidatus Binataceae bacterium]|nr:hypothetical protein [Candidatus Binataceae bacterium]